ncbi:unnamed protein product [Lactuca virosa]|uniref:Uncharacterized protein n=1 Tax=Lactuca virosa TaxID=75947 RepID=A0AAU9LTN6_9ASTR|nr:unnamed protein product [Lactuca virosa]
MLQFSFEEIEVSDDEEDQEDEGNELSENEFENFIQQSISFLEEDRTARKPPQIVPIDTEPPSGSDLEDSPHALLPRKCKRRYPRPGVLITDQDVQSPIVEEEFILTEGAQASGSSFELPELDISKGKSKLPESKFVDVALLQNRVFVLEQSSAEKDLIIGKHDIRISELEKENSIKDAKISELQANLGGLTTLFFDLQQRLHQNFGDEFQPLSAEREKITASSSGPANPTPQSTSEKLQDLLWMPILIHSYPLVLLLLKKGEGRKLELSS